MKLIGTKQKKKTREESVGQIHVFSYKLLNEHVKFMYPKLRSLEKSIKQSMMPIPFEVYVSSMVFFSMIAGVCGIIMGVIAIQFINIQPASVGFLLPLITGLMLFGVPVFCTHLNWKYQHGHIRQRQVADLARFVDSTELLLSRVQPRVWEKLE